AGLQHIAAFEPKAFVYSSRVAWFCTVAVLAQYEGGGGRSQIGDAPSSPQSSNLRVGSQLPFHIVTAGPEDDAGGAAGREPGETFAQLLAIACEGHLFG